ncbi:MAG TPA: phosphatidate cytidylyltransferase [Burkholderiales bacterium]|nr:phosphatidate cytidylyltransferase [Burkholderiales bacterium]
MATATVLVLTLLGALFLLTPAWLKALLTLLLIAAAYEWARLCGMQPLLYGLSTGIVFFLAPHDAAWFLIAAAFWVVVAPLWLAFGVAPAQKRMLALAGIVVLVPAGLAVLVLPAQLVLGVLALTWIADTAAYFVGIRYGRHKLAPSISPGKSREGALGGLAAVLVYAVAVSAAWQQAHWLLVLCAAAVLGVLSIVGDLFESAAKRQAAVKDSGALLPGHGGILDRIDSATSTLPIAAALAPWIIGK